MLSADSSYIGVRVLTLGDNNLELCALGGNVDVMLDELMLRSFRHKNIDFNEPSMNCYCDDLTSRLKIRKNTSISELFPEVGRISDLTELYIETRISTL